MRHYDKICLSQLGLAFISVLFFLQIFAIFTLFTLRSRIIEIQVMQGNSKKYNFSQAAEQALKEAEANLKQSLPVCQIPNTARATLVKEAREWWQSHACSGSFKSYRYYYVVESLGIDECAVPVSANNIPLGTADYYRITVLLTQPGQILMKQFLQSTVIAVSQVSAMNCTGTTRLVSSGRQFRLQLF